jgi:hypothetical protein
MSDIHSCSYYCTRPACVLAQRDELRDRLAQQAEPVADDGVRQAAAMFISAWDWANQGPTAPHSLRGWIDILRERLAKPVQAEPVVGPEHWVVTAKVGDTVVVRAPGLKKGDKVYPRPQQQAAPQQAEPVVTWGVDWGEDEDWVSIVKRHPDGTLEVVATEGRPVKRQADDETGNPSF